MGWIGPEGNRRVVAGPRRPMGPMPGRTPNLQPAVSLKVSWDSRAAQGLLRPGSFKCEYLPLRPLLRFAKLNNI